MFSKIPVNFQPKWTRVMSLLVANYLGISKESKTVSLKKRSKSMFQPMKLCSKWVCLEVSSVDGRCAFFFFLVTVDPF